MNSYPFLWQNQMSELHLFVHQAQYSVWADSRGALSRLTRSVELADSGSWASSCEEFRWGLQIRFVRFSIYLVERSVSLSRELCGHRDWVNSRYEPKRIQKITKRQPNEQWEQKPLSATAESSCLDYAESQVRKKNSPQLLNLLTVEIYRTHLNSLTDYPIVYLL